CTLQCLDCISHDYLKKTTKFPNSFMIWGCMSGKGPGEMAILISTVNAEVYIEILDTILIPSIEKKFGDDLKNVLTLRCLCANLLRFTYFPQ
uniref:Uncharacterized protein n=1 Tax=Sinocyclocheilus anshuiensis TaxID=1608454 RepID=A0A671MDT3_9TELE